MSAFGSMKPVILALMAALAPVAQAGIWQPADDVRTAAFGDPYTAEVPDLLISPDARLVAVYAETGDLSRNRRVGRLRIYRNPSRDSGPEQPLLEVIIDDLATGPAIHGLQWDADSKGLSFVHPLPSKGEVLQHIDVATKRRTELARTPRRILGYAIQSPGRFVYAEQDPPSNLQESMAVRAATGQSLTKIEHPNLWAGWIDRGRLWFVQYGSRLPIVDPVLHRQAIVYGEGAGTLSLSPDGTLLAFAAPAWSYPSDWRDYPAGDDIRDKLPPALSPQDDIGIFGLSHYVVVDLATGAWSIPSRGPTARSMGWGAGAGPAWSSNSRLLVLPGAFRERASRPCILAVDVIEKTSACLVELGRGGEPNAKVPFEMRFLRSDLKIHFFNYGTGRTEDEVWSHRVTGPWQGRPEREVRELGLRIEQSPSEPARLVTRRGRVVWDPNREIRHRLSRVDAITWTDGGGAVRQGGLYWPADYESGRHYPLVVQTHGFSPEEFRPSGVFPGDFAALTLAAHGFFVLQVREACPNDAHEVECAAEAYRSGVSNLVAKGLIDPKRVGIAGFSRSCLYVLEALTRDPDVYGTAILFDGITGSYTEYVQSVDVGQDEYARESRTLFGALPYGDGLQAWIKRAPAFHVDRIAAPVLIEAPKIGVDAMWEPYANLRYLHKPVELQIVDTAEHPPTEPRIESAMSELTLDWFRFWLQNFKSVEPAKAEQYRRWEELKLEQHRAAGSARGP